VPDRTEISSRVDYLSRRIDDGLFRTTNALSTKIAHAASQLEAYLRHPRERLQRDESLLWRELDRISGKIDASQAKRDQLEHGLQGFERLIVARRKEQLTSLERVLRGFDPQAILGRGYAIVRHDKKLIRTSRDAKVGDSLMIQLAEGQIDTEVTKLQ
jgi:exodeoxyribonuclease VII large subunit